MKMITDYEVEGGWTTKEAKSKCRNCGTIKELVPEKGHYNSKYWELKRNDGLDLFCCPNGCSVEEADRKFKLYAKIANYCIKGGKSESWNYKLDYKKVNCGWISPKGILYPCEYKEHIDSCYDFFNKSEASIEEEGYFKLSLTISNHHIVEGNRIPTKKQIETIIDWAHSRNYKTKEFYKEIEDTEENLIFSFIFDEKGK